MENPEARQAGTLPQSQISFAVAMKPKRPPAAQTTPAARITSAQMASGLRSLNIPDAIKGAKDSTGQHSAKTSARKLSLVKSIGNVSAATINARKMARKKIRPILRSEDVSTFAGKMS